MKKDMIELIGLVAGALTTSGYIPQIYSVIKHNSAEGLSGLFLIIMTIGISLWLLYGIIQTRWLLFLQTLLACFVFCIGAFIN
jgi:hypothetical protein